MFLAHLTYGSKKNDKKKNKKNQSRNRHPVRTGFKILVMVQQSEINIPQWSNTKDKKHDASSSTGSASLWGTPLAHSFAKKWFSPYILLTCGNFTCANSLVQLELPYPSCWRRALMISRRVNQYSAFQNIHGTKQLRPTYFYYRQITISICGTQRKQRTEKKATLQSAYLPKSLSMGFYTYYWSVMKFWRR